MKVTFLGDVASPEGVAPLFDPAECGFDFSVVNLEGALRLPGADGGHPKRAKLYSAPGAIETLHRWGTRVACLANNHILDVDRSPVRTIRALEAEGIAACGAGADLEEAARPAVVREDGHELVFLAFGWSAQQCIPATARRPGVNPLEPDHVLRSVERARAAHPSARVVVMMHWNIELELYPQPMHRQLAFAAVDAGADAVIGHHPHRVSGIEVHRGAPIVYSLGNWFFPHGTWFGWPVHFPPAAARQLAFEWDPAGSSVCHWFEFDPRTNRLRREASEPLETSAIAGALTPFRGMDHGEYVAWFRANRVKRLGLPVYADYRSRRANWLRDRWLDLRMGAIAAALTLRIKRPRTH